MLLGASKARARDTSCRWPALKLEPTYRQQALLSVIGQPRRAYDRTYRLH